MLVVTREVNQGVVCTVKVPGGPDVVIRVLVSEVRGDRKVRLAFEAERDRVTIHRDEVQAAIERGDSRRRPGRPPADPAGGAA